MKKYLLFIISMLCVSIGTWANTTVDIRTSDGTTTITITGDGTETVTFADDCDNLPGKAVNIVVTGPLTEAVWTAIKDNKAGWNTQADPGQVIDLKGVTGLTTSELLNVGMFSDINGTNNTNYIILPTDSDVPTALQTKSNTKPSFDNWDALKYFIIPQTDGSCKVVIVDLDEQSTTDYTTSIISHLVLGTGIKKVEVLAITNDDQNPATIANKEAVETELVKAGYELKQAALTVDGCAVTVNMNGAEAGQTLADLIATAKAAVIAGGQTGIRTLTVKGELTANDLIALGGTNMNDATRIDLSGATLASGVSIDDLQIPSSLTSLVLPKNTTVTVGLKTKMTNWTNLSYAYSPSTGVTEKVGEEEHPVVADYVWVNKAGGMAAALTAETSLTTSKYIKVASNVALNTSDVNFSSTTALKYLDLRYANFTSAVSSSFVSSSATGYRIILPDDWTEDEMATFAGVLGSANVAWAMAGIYSYSGTTLRIHELADDKYMPTALSNSRIVYPGTTAIKIVGTTLDTKLLAALNAAASSVKTITVTASSLNALTFNNPNITTLNVEGLNKGTATVTAGTGCTSLTTLNVTGSTVASVVATGVNSLTTVNLNGTTISGETNLSNTGLTTFTTNSSTKLQGDINLMSTALTSLNTTAEIGTTTADTGNILLNGCESLGSITLGGAQFKNSTSMIHIDKSTTENSENKDAIDLLSRTETVGGSPVAVKTIFVPNGFNSEGRIHPYAEVQNNVSEVAGSSANEDNDKCSITYDATTKVATVHTNEPGHFANMMETRYASYPLGTTFKFDATSQINEADLKALAGTINTNDYSWRSNYYYVDLYDLPASAALCDNTTGVIGKTINWLRANDRQFKGLILPKDHTRYGSGISLIQSENPKHEGELSTCSEFIAYFKTKDIVNNVETNLPKKILFTHVYNQTATNSEGIQASNDKLTELLTAHGLNGAATNCPVDLYSVSTNGVVPFDATTLVGDKGYVETFNNEMVGPDTRANIYAYPSAVGEFTTFVDYSSIGVTTTEVLKIDGTVSSDASAVAASINRFTNGPRVLDLKEIKPNSDEFLSALLPALTNSNIEYIILPGNKSKSLVCGTSYTNMANLKAVISSTSTNLVAYIDEAGSLAEARYYATGGSITGNIFTPTQTGLQSVTLAGHLNASDIAANTTDHYLDENGHWTTTSGNLKSVALWGEQGTIATIDLKDAVFEEYTPTGGKLTSDMNFSYAGLGSIRNITLPTSSSMTLIPENCFNGITSFDDLCIPYNYTKIDNRALYGTYCSHITTTDANGALVDNGPKTYTFSKNLEEIGTKPTTADTYGVYSLTETVFPQNRGVTDVYVLAHKVPKCYANAFPANMLYGWGGFKGGDFPYCREKYDNSADGSMIFTVLHFPDKASYTTATEKTGSSYEDMEKLYTDINKVYTKKEQTGAVDANGDPIAWPTFAELRRAYNQATSGDQWYDWNILYDGQGSINGGNYIPVGTEEYTLVQTGTDPNTSEKDYDFSSYEGWHQFSLSMATYVEPDKTVVNDVVKTNYVQGAWYTLCIPFSLTLDQAIEILGIPKSVEGKTENYLSGMLVDSDHLPDVRTLQTVTRTPGTTNTVTMKFTQNLLADGLTRYWSINYSDPDQSNYSQGTSSGNSIAIRGGYPYLIRPYLPANEVVKNLGKYIMTRYGDKFEQTRSCIYIDGCAQDLAPYSSSQKTGRFAKPFEGHKIQAVWDDNNNTTPKYRTHSDGKNYNYTFVGQFWDQKLPRYCFYMVENSDNTAGKWYRLASDKNYRWNQYKCVIMVTQEVNDVAPEGRKDYLYTNSGKFRNNDQTAATHSIYPASTGTDAQGAYKFNAQLYIEFLNGLDDADFTEAAGARYVITFDDFIQELDEEGNSTTSIESLDGETINKIPTDGKVYNLSGQLVGNSIDGLEKGMYIVNGKKYIVR